MKIFLFFQFVLLFTTSCGYKKDFDSKYYCDQLQINCLKKDKIVSFFTSKGNFQVKINVENYPVTSSNFIENIKNGVYRNKKFYKILNYSQVKVIHGGVITKDYYLENKEMKKYSSEIPLEIKIRNQIEPKYKNHIDDPSLIENISGFFERGSLAMVKSGKKNSSSTEFFFVTNAIPALDGRYSIFGKIIRGVEVLDEINDEDLIYEIKITN